MVQFLMILLHFQDLEMTQHFYVIWKAQANILGFDEIIYLPFDYYSLFNTWHLIMLPINELHYEVLFETVQQVHS
jgi:hypothetical protein